MVTEPTDSGATYFTAQDLLIDALPHEGERRSPA
jgi:hypothetical protein